MGELTHGKADLALVPLTITADRAADISYTIPYLAEGYNMVVRKVSHAY